MNKSASACLLQSLQRSELKERDRYRGVKQIVRFNWPWYVFATLSAACLAIGSIWVPIPWRFLLRVGACLGIFWTVLSLLASHWVYDLSELRDSDWIRKVIPSPDRALILHAGFDESVPGLRKLFPACSFEEWDFYQTEIITERSIMRARQSCRTNARAVNFANLPAESGSFDVVFVIFSAHEIRTEQGRRAFFRELWKVVRPGGEVILVEHLRDTANFLAYGPGFLHFLPGTEWRRQATNAGLAIADHFRITPLVNVFRLRKGEIE